MKGKKWENCLCIHWWKQLNPNYSTSRDKEIKGSSKSPETISLNNGSSTDSVCLHSLDIQFRPLMNRWTVRKCRKRVPLGETSARPASPDIRGMLSVISSLRTESCHGGVARRGHRRVQEWPRRCAGQFNMSPRSQTWSAGHDVPLSGQIWFLAEWSSGKQAAAATFRAVGAPLLINRKKNLLITDTITRSVSLGANLIFGRWDFCEP